MHLRSRLLFFAGLLTIAIESNGQLTLKLPYKQVSVKNENGKAVFTGVSNYGLPGQPELPVHSVTFLLPPGTNPQNVSVSVENPVDSLLSGNWYVAPAFPPIREDQSAPKGEYPKDMKVYGQNAFFPASWTGSASFGKMDDDQLVEIAINLCKYNPVTGEIKVLVGGTLTVSIQSQGETQVATPIRSAWTKVRLRELIINPEALNDASTDAQANGAALSVNTTPENYVIITTNAIVAAIKARPLGGIPSTNILERYKNYLLSAGFGNVIIATENDWGGGIGDDAAENIRQWLKNHYKDYNIHYALLIGNPDLKNGDVPMKKVYPEQNEPNTTQNKGENGKLYDIGGVPTDFYYAELSGNWDVDKDDQGISKPDRRYGEFRDDYVDGGADKYAEIQVGRIPYYGQIEELASILTKSIYYAQSTDNYWRKNILFPMVPVRSDAPEHHLGEQIKNDFCIPNNVGYYRLYNENDSKKALYTDVIDMYPPMNDVPCTEDKVLDAWTHNYFGMVTWATHGNSRDASYVFSAEKVTKLDNTHPSMVFSTSCSNAAPDDAHNLAYSLLANGAITVVASSAMSTWGISTDYSQSGYNEGVAYSYTSFILCNTNCGIALNCSKQRYVSTVGSTEWLQCMLFNLYGCPELSLNTPSLTPAPPTHLQVVSGMSHEFYLTWMDNANNETGYLALNGHGT